MDLSTIGFRPMTEADLPAVDAIEQAVQPYPWRISQFADSLKAGHQAWLFTEAGQPFGYAVLLAALDEVELLFDDSALLAIAEKAMKKDTGARALRAIIEEFMLDIMYEIPKDENIGRVTITGDYINGKGGPLIEIRKDEVQKIGSSRTPEKS